MKTCRKCDTEKPITEFHKSPSNRDRLQHYCKSCACEITAQWRLENPTAARRAHLARIGWTLELFEQAMELQNGICANPACSNPAECADHDHATAAPRWVLCKGCNLALGHVQENIARLFGLVDLLTGVVPTVADQLQSKGW